MLAGPSPAGASAAAADAARRLAGKTLVTLGQGFYSAGSLVARGVGKGLTSLAGGDASKESIRFLDYQRLVWSGPGGAHELPVLLVGLETGFQVFALTGSNPQELSSRRDGSVRLLEALPEPLGGTEAARDDPLAEVRPLLAVVPAPPPEPFSAPHSATAHPPSATQPQQQHVVQLYSLRTHGYVRTLSFTGEVLGLRASPRVLLVALRAQLQAFDAATLQHTFSCLTYVPLPPPLPRLSPQQQQQQGGSPHAAAQEQQQGAAAASAAAVLAPFALGPRWVAHASDQPLAQASAQAAAQRLPLARRSSSGNNGSNGGGGKGPPGTSPSSRSSGGSLFAAGVSELALSAAAKGGQQLKAGLTAVGSASFKMLSHQYQQWRGQAHPADALDADAAVAGTVVVRDVCSRRVVAQFRAHTSPLALLQFSPCGTLLATASVHGHNVNIFRIVPATSSCGGGSSGGTAGGDAAAGHAVHLLRLHRGLTPAAIRGVSFAPDASWVAVSSGRGTTHLFHTPVAAAGGGDAAGAAAAYCAAASAAPPGEDGVAGEPLKLLALARARKPGLLGGGGAAGAAASAAFSLYGQSADPAPVAAAFLPANPSSGSSSPHGRGGGPAPASGGDTSLFVVTADGLLTRHALRAPPADAAAAAGLAGVGAATPSQGGNGSAPAGDSGTAGNNGVLPVLEEAERWDVCRQHSWPEREEPLPGQPPAAEPGSGGSSSGGEEEEGGEPRPLQLTALGRAASAEADAAAIGGGGFAGALPGALQQQDSVAASRQLWVAQAEGGVPPPGATPLWQSPQFRFVELPLPLSSPSPAAGSAAAAAGEALGLASLLAGAQLGALSSSGASAASLAYGAGSEY